MISSPVLDAYVDQVAARLPGPPRARRDIVAELRSGLLDAVDAHHDAGLPAATAAEAAVTEFGDPRLVADAFRPELTMKQARRVAVALAAAGPPIGFLWAAAALASHIAIRHAAPWPWADLRPLSLVAFSLAAGAVLITVCSALATMAATGRLTRWLADPSRIAAATAATAGFGAAAADVALFALLASQLASAPGALAPTGRGRRDGQPDPAGPGQTRRGPVPGRPRGTRLSTPGPDRGRSPAGCPGHRGVASLRGFWPERSSLQPCDPIAPSRRQRSSRC